MCIIAVKPKNKEMIPMDYLKNCFINNSDGAGYMYNTPGERKVVIKKGFMTFESFKKSLETEGDLTKSDVVFHFRLATHGLTNEANCHPFPITSHVPSLKEVKHKTRLGIAHNGIISYCYDEENVLSDTQVFIKDYLSYVPEKYLYDKKSWKGVGYNKFALLNCKGFFLVGDFIEDGDYFYSNYDYCSAYKYYGYNLFDLTDSEGEDFPEIMIRKSRFHDDLYDVVYGEEVWHDVSMWDIIEGFDLTPDEFAKLAGEEFSNGK